MSDRALKSANYRQALLGRPKTTSCLALAFGASLLTPAELWAAEGDSEGEVSQAAVNKSESDPTELKQTELDRAQLQQMELDRTELKQRESLSERDAVRQALSENAGLRAALLDVARAEQDVAAARALYTPIFQADAGFTHSENPQVTLQGDYVPSINDTYTIGAELRHTFSWGTAVQARLEGSRTSSRVSITPGSSDFVTIGPNWGPGGRLSVQQPLLRGFGKDIGEAELRQARLGRTLSEKSRDLRASQLLRDVLSAYWELWYQERAVELEENALKLAIRRRDEAVIRAAAGGIPEVEILTFETRVAELELSLDQAQAGTRTRALELRRLLGSNEVQLLRTSNEAPLPPDLPTDDQKVIDRALDESVELAQSDAQISLASDRAKVAGAAQEPRLDVEAYMHASSLSTGDVTPAFSRFITDPALSAHVGVVFEIPVSKARRTAETQRARLEVETAQAQRSEVKSQVLAQIETRLSDARASATRASLAERTQVFAKRQAEAQQARYDQGAGLAVEVQIADDSFRRASLSVARAQVDRISSMLALEHLTGELLARYAGDIDRLELANEAKGEDSSRRKSGSTASTMGLGDFRGHF